MPQFDLPRHELERYRPDLPEPDDLAGFWAGTLADARDYPLDVRWDATAGELLSLETFDVTFRGFGGHPVGGWLHLPIARDRAGADGRLPAVVQYHGYGAGRGLPHETMLFA